MTNTLLCHLHVVYGLYIVFVLWEQTHQNYCTTFLCGKPQMRESSLYSLILNSSHLQWTCVCVCVDTVAAHRNGTLLPLLKDAGALMIVET